MHLVRIDSKNLVLIIMPHSTTYFHMRQYIHIPIHWQRATTHFAITLKLVVRHIMEIIVVLIVLTICGINC